MESILPHQLIFIRHAETRYSNIYPDITENGVNELKSTAKKIEPLIAAYPHQSLKIIASPAMRAQGSAGILAQELKYNHEIIIEPRLSDMGYPNWPKALEIFTQCNLNGGRVEDVYDMDDRFEDETIFEPRTAVRERFYAYMRECCSELLESSSPQCVLHVSHFEILNHFLKHLWPDVPWLKWADFFSISLQPSASNDEVAVTVSYKENSHTANPISLFGLHVRTLMPA
jgi:broad specificity phosphatase PhoE